MMVARVHVVFKDSASVSSQACALEAARRYGAGDYVRARDWRVEEDHKPLPQTIMVPAVVPIKAPFVHVPTIHLMRGGVLERVLGPVATTTRVTSETAIGWNKWYHDLQGHGIAVVQASKAEKDRIDAELEPRRRKKANELAGMYSRACDRLHRAGKQVPSFEAWKADRCEAAYQRECKKLIAAGYQPRTREQFFAPAPNWETFAPPTLVNAVRASNKRGYNKQRLERYDSKGKDFAGRKTARFIEEFVDADGSPTVAFRSAICIALALFHSALPKDMIYGGDKTKVYSALGTDVGRMDVRDKAYLELARNRRCHFVVDLDGWWPSVKRLWKAIRKFLPPEFMPNLISYRGREVDGHGVENPHLIWMLPPGSRVIPRKGANNIDGQTQLHKMIQRCIVNKLIELGADPCHHNSDKMKNPLAPGWSIVCNDDNFATMSEWKAYLPTITPDERAMKRRAQQLKIERENNVEAELSNAMWRDGIDSRKIVIKAAQRRRDPEFLAARKKLESFVDWLYHPVTGAVVVRMLKVLKHEDGPALRQILHAQREFVVGLKELPSAAGQFFDHGRDRYRNQRRDADSGLTLKTAEEREALEIMHKSDAGKISRANERAIHCGLIAEEIERRLSLGLPVDRIEAERAAIVKTLVAGGNVTRATAYRLFPEVVAVVSEAARYQARPIHGRTTEPSPSQPRQAVTVEASLSETPASGSAVPSIRSSGGRRRVQPFGPEQSKCLQAHLMRESWRRAVSAWRDACRRRHEETDEMTLPSPTVSSAFWSNRRHGAERHLRSRR